MSTLLASHRTTNVAALMGGAVVSSLLTNLVAYYAMETLGLDSSGNGNTLTNNNGVSQVAGVVGNAASFTAASSQTLSIPDNAFFDSITTQAGISLWFRPNNIGDQPRLLGQHTGLYITQISSLTLVGLGNDYGYANFPVTNGSWFHVAVSYDGTATGNDNRLKIWINGAAQTLGFDGTTIPASVPSVVEPFALGGNVTAGNLYLDGLMDEVGLWSRPLSVVEVATLYNSGAGTTYPFS